MAKIKDFCTSSNSDLVKKLKTTYHLSVKQARTVINTARRNNPALQAYNITWDFLTSQPEFKDALSKYVNLEEESYSPEMKDIKNKAIADGTFMKAPNGKPTNLEEKQWLQIRTKAFKNWFGDWENDPANASKVVDRNGEPLVVYHGSNEEFDTFNLSYTNKNTSESSRTDKNVVWFGNEEFALEFGKNKYPVFLNIRNPFYKSVEFDEINKAVNTASDSKNDGGFLTVREGEGNSAEDEIFIFSQNQIKSATDNSGAFSTEDNDIYDTKTVQEEVNQATGEDFTEEQVKEMQSRASEIIDQNKVSKLSAKDMKDLLDAFKDPRRLAFLGDWMVHYAHRMVTEIMLNPQYRERFGLDANATRRDVYMNIAANNAIRKNILAELDRVAEDWSDDAERQTELNYAKTHLNNMLFMFGSQLYKWDNIGVDKEGNFFVPGSKDYLSEEENATQDQKLDGEHPTNDFSASDQNEPIDTKIIPEIKALLTDIVGVDKEGEDIADPYYYGFSTYMPVQQTVNKLLVICQGCNTFEEMKSRLESFRRGTPWVGRLLDMLNDSTEDSDYSSNISKSRKEQLQTQFFVSFHKNRTEFVNTYTAKDNAIVTRDISERSNARKIYGNILSKFRRHAGAGIFDNGVINLETINELYQRLSGGVRERGSILNAIAESRKLTNDLDAAYGKLSGAEKTLLGVMKSLGLDINDQMLDDYLSAENEERDFRAFINRSERLAKLHNRLSSLVENMKNLEPVENPFEKEEGEEEYRWKIRKDFRTVIDMLTEYSPDTYESMYYANGKSYYQWNNPSSVQTILNNLNNPNRQKAKDYIMRKYGRDALWFLRPGKDPHFYSDWLEELYNGTGNISIDYKEKPIAFGKSYADLSDREYALSLLNDFMQRQDGGNDTALYRMIIASDKPRYALVKAPRRDSKYIYDKANDFLAQEINRAIDVVRFAVRNNGTNIKNYDIKINDDTRPVIEKVRNKEKVTIDDVLKDGRYIFRNTGASFFMNKFLNDEIEKKTKLGEYLVDRIFNADQHIGEPLVTPEALTQFRHMFSQYMGDTAMAFLKNLNSMGALEYIRGKDKILHSRYILPMLKSWHSSTDEEWMLFQQKMYADRKHAAWIAQKLDGVNIVKPEDMPYYCELFQLGLDIGMFCGNNWLAKANMMQVFDVDPAFYGNTTNYQKREAQIISAGITADRNALLHSKPVTDGKYRSITIKTNKLVSNALENIRAMLQKQAETISDPKQKSQFIAGMNDTLEKLSKMDATDGQAFTGLTALRKRLVGRGEWSRSENESIDNTGYIEKDGMRKYVFTDEAVYQRLKRGYKTKEDQEAKAYDLMHVFAEPQKPFMYGFAEIQRPGRTMVSPVQHKNSEYQLSFLTAFAVQEADKSRDDKKLSQLEALAIFLEESAKQDSLRGIDTINFDSAVKIGENSDSIDLNNLDGYQTLEKLRESVYGDKNAEKTPQNYKSGVVTEYDVEDYKIISNKPEHFRDSSQPMGTQMKVLAIANTRDDAQLTLQNGKIISGKDLKRRYLKALATKTERAESAFYHDMGLDLPREDRMHRLSNILKRLMASDQRFDAEMRHALGVTGKDGELQFNIPLDEPGLQQSIEAMIYSKIRQVYYRQATSGGIVVQATSWGASEDLNIRFFSSNPEDKDGLIPVKKEWLKKNPNGDYEAYCRQYQKGYAWFEFEAPMPDYIRKMLSNKNGKIKDKYFNPDGSWNMEEIRKDVPASAFDAISYRIPTESKYSMMVCKLVRFTNNEGGNICRYPKELTTFTGSDFDIDTDVIELRPQPGKSNRDVDSELFNLQMASLQNNNSLQETFHAGDFSDLSELSYKVKLWEEDIDTSDISDLKSACDAVEDLDIMDPMTDVLLRRQNMEAKKLIGIAAVGVTSHAFFSLYNSSPENSVRINFRNAKKMYNIEEESIHVINDRDGSDLTLGGYMPLDSIYDMDGKLISLEIGKYVGASADAAKDAALYRLGINETTMPVLITMHRLGISSDIARLFIAQPVIKTLSERINNGETKSVADLCDQMAKEIEAEGVEEEWLYEGQWNDIRFAPSTLRLSALEKNIKDGQSYEDQLMILHAFKTLHALSRTVNNLDSYVRYNSMRAMDGSSVLSRYAQRRKLDNLATTLTASKPRIKLPENIQGKGLDKLANMFPYIDMAITGEEELTDGLLLENMKTYNSTFFRLADRLLGDNDVSGEQDARVLNILYNAWKSWLLFNGQNKIVDFSEEQTVKKYTTEFPYHYAEEIDRLSSDKKFYNDVLLGNSFIRSIGYTRSSTDNFDLLTTDVNGMSGEDIDKYKSDWAELLNHSETRQLAIDLGIYFLARNSDYSAGTPVHLIPVQVKEAIENYLGVFEKAGDENLTGKDFIDFLKKFQQNNSTDGKIIPRLYNINGANDFVVKQEKGQNILYISQDKIGSIKRWCEDIGEEEPEYIFRMPVINIDGTLYEVSLSESLTHGEDYWSIKLGNELKPLGVENEFVEYTGLDKSVFGETEPNPENPIEPPVIDGDKAKEIADCVVESLSDATMGELNTLLDDDGFKFSKDNLKGLIATMLNSNLQKTKENFVNAGMTQPTADELFGKIKNELTKRNICI